MRALALVLLAGCNQLALTTDVIPVDGGVDLTSIDLTTVDLSKSDLTMSGPTLTWQPSGVPCGPALPRFGGALCGPSPCAIGRDEVVDATAQFRNDAPDVAAGADGQPAIFYSSAVGNFIGYVATSGANGWNVNTTPPALASASLTFDGKGELQLLGDEGNLVVDYLHGGARSWSAAEVVTPNYIGAHTLVADSAGCLYATALYTDNEKLIVGQRQGGVWSWGWLDSAHAYGYEYPALALGSDGRLQTTYRAGDTSSISLWWSQPPSAPEQVTQMPGGGFGGGALRLGTAGTTPHILFYDGQALQYATRAGGTWTTIEVERDQDSSSGFCDTAMDGAQCTQHMMQHVPLGVLASDGGDVRLLYAATDTAIVSQWSCPNRFSPDLGMAPPQCGLVELSRTSTGSISVAWPENFAVSHALVKDNIGVISGTATLDVKGTIHVALYVPGDPDNYSTVRYLSITP